MIIINILTRTSNRPNYFRQNYNSIKNQKIDNNVKINHIVSYDNDVTKEYLDEYDDIIKVQVFNTKKGTFPYNEYLNTLHSYINAGYIMYLDDDDILLEDSISLIIPHLNPNHILIWRVKYFDRIIPNDKTFSLNKITKGDICSNSYIYHSNILKTNNLLWKPTKGGDHIFIKKLNKIIKNTKWINCIISQVNNIGNGKKNDMDSGSGEN